MFTGIVSELGAVVETERRDAVTAITIEAPQTTRGLRVGDSIAVNGVCLTSVACDEATFAVEVVQESLDRSSLGDLVVGSTVNLERPLTVDGRLDGHIVQGHVDGVGTVVSIAAEGEAKRFRISVANALTRYMVEKGSIAVDGISLTITNTSGIDAVDAWFEMVLIPHTLDVTVLGNAVVGTRVNLEVDVIAKYVERMMGANT